MFRASKRVTAAIAIAFLSTSALAATQMGNNSNKGSLLVGPRVDVRNGVDTFITLVNDSSVNVSVKCYYRASDPVSTNYGGVDGGVGGVGGLKYTVDFAFTLTHNQPVTWSARTGRVVSDSSTIAGAIAPPFRAFPQGDRRVGEIKCWAVDETNLPIAHNHLYMDIAVLGSPFGAAGQAYEYMAWAFQAIPNNQTVNGISGRTSAGQIVPPNQNGPLPGSVSGESIAVLLLDGRSYDYCPNILLGSFQPSAPVGEPPCDCEESSANVAAQVQAQVSPSDPTLISLASCMQDMTESPRPFFTKYLYTIWNQDEVQRTGWFECADSWYETNLSLGPFSLRNVGTHTAYVRIESVGDTDACGDQARHFGFVGMKASSSAGGVLVRGTNLVGRGTVGANPNVPQDNCGDNFVSPAAFAQGGVAATGAPTPYDPTQACAIIYNPGTGDSFKK